MVGQLLWRQDQKRKKYAIEGSDEAANLQAQLKEEGEAVHLEQRPGRLEE